MLRCSATIAQVEMSRRNSKLTQWCLLHGNTQQVHFQKKGAVISSTSYTASLELKTKFRANVPSE